MSIRPTSSLLLIAMAAGLMLSPGQALSQKVGITGAVNPASTGTAPGSSTRTLQIGGDVVYKERIRTTASGSLQVLFVDTTTLSVGPNSDLTIDQFVFDPAAGSGTFVASLAKGSLRFVGGKISHTAGATIKTPVATMGIRGSVTYIALENGKLEAINAFGELTVTPTTPGAESFSVPEGDAMSLSTGAPPSVAPATTAAVSAANASVASGSANANATNTSLGLAGETSAGASTTNAEAAQTQTPDVVQTQEEELRQEAAPEPPPRGDDEVYVPPPEP